MKPPRRQFLHLAAGAVTLPAVSQIARAQTYPTRSVRIIVGLAAGGAADIVARLVAHSLSDRLGQQFVIENRPGAGTNIAAEAVVRAMGDGYTALYATSANATNATLYDKLNFDFIRDTTPVAGVIRIPLVLVANPSFPPKSLPELIAYAKANPGKVNMASAGSGTPGHLAGELLKMMADVDIVHVPYRGGAPAVIDLLGGQVQIYFSVVPDSIEFIRAGRLRPLAMTSATRSEVLPDLPTVSDSLPGYEVSSWHGIVMPKNTSAAIIEKLNKEINAVLADAKLKARFAEFGGTALGGTSADFGRFIVDEIERLGKVVKFAGIKPD